MFMCSDAGQKLLRTAICEEKLTRVVVASCTPKLHEHTFKEVVAQAGLNPYHFEMANIREQSSWVHYTEPKRATAKAKHIIRSAINRVITSEPIDELTVAVEQSVLVIGGGIGGVQASLDLANMGIKTYLVEREATIGGMMAKLVKTFPTGDCAMCILSPKLAEAITHPNIEILTNAELVNLNGYIGNFDVLVRVKPRYVNEELCISCGKCTERCPVEILNTWNLQLGKRKAIDLPFAQAVPRTYSIEASACLMLTKNRCGLCEKHCPAGAIEFAQVPIELKLKVGTIIVATGADEYVPDELAVYRYMEHPDIITQLELARILDPLGPTGGRLQRPSDGKMPQSLLMIQCVGSRDMRYNSYCSRVCCMTAIKHALMIREEQNPEANIFICYIDLRCFGKGYEEYYKRASERGIHFIRGKVAEINILEPSTNGTNLYVLVEDTLQNELVALYPDLIILSTGLVPAKGFMNLANMLRLNLDPTGFVSERHPKLAPVDTNIDGIYVCGTAQGPRDIPDTVASARAAAVAAATPIIKKQITIELAKAMVTRELCTGCKLCVDLCPFGAISMTSEEWTQTATVIEVLCKSCGICAAKCPTGAIELKHYKMAQMLAQISSICKRDNMN
jgi:heterodisulfide reductase subunit A